MIRAWLVLYFYSKETNEEEILLFVHLSLIISVFVFQWIKIQFSLLFVLS